MSKIELTALIGQKIKELRLRHQVKSKDLATFLEKSPAYISKLEKGDLNPLRGKNSRKLLALYPITT